MGFVRPRREAASMNVGIGFSKHGSGAVGVFDRGRWAGAFSRTGARPIAFHHSGARTFRCQLARKFPVAMVMVRRRLGYFRRLEI